MKRKKGLGIKKTEGKGKIARKMKRGRGRKKGRMMKMGISIKPTQMQWPQADLKIPILNIYKQRGEKRREGGGGGRETLATSFSAVF